MEIIIIISYEEIILRKISSIFELMETFEKLILIYSRTLYAKLNE